MARTKSGIDDGGKGDDYGGDNDAFNNDRMWYQQQQNQNQHRHQHQHQHQQQSPKSSSMSSPRHRPTSYPEAVQEEDGGADQQGSSAENHQQSNVGGRSWSGWCRWFNCYCSNSGNNRKNPWCAFWNRLQRGQPTMSASTSATSIFRESGGGFHSWMMLCSENIVNSVVWRTIIVLFTILLLFGSPLQFWLVPAEGDGVFDIFYIFGFVTFIVDIVLNSYADPEYFICDPCNRTLQRERQAAVAAAVARSVSEGDTNGGTAVATTIHANNISDRTSSRKFTIGFGSFNFWCDVISSAGFLYDVSTISLNKEFATPTAIIDLDMVGVPINFDEVVNAALPVEANVNFIFLVVKTARVARLVPSTTVVALSSRINLYWFVERLTIKFYWRLYQKRRERRRRQKGDEESMSGTTGLVRKGSWGGLEIAAVASVKQMQEEERKKKTMGARYICYKLNKWTKETLRFLRILPNTSSELNRQIAATKIQRVWRNRHSNNQTRSEDGFMLGSIDGSFAGWHGGNRDTGVSSFRKGYTIGSRRGVGNGPSSRMLRSQRGISQRNAAISAANNQQQKQQNSNKSWYDYNSPKLFERGKGARAQSQVGTAMAEVTGQRVGVFILLSLFFVLTFTYIEADSTRASSMVVLHGQTVGVPNEIHARTAVETARMSTLDVLYAFKSNSMHYNTSLYLEWNVSDYDIDTLRDREKQAILVKNQYGQVEGYFVIKEEQNRNAQIEILATVFVLLLWFFGVAAFASPIMTFVIIPIERMIRLLGMLMMDPLGYQSNLRFKKFLLEEDAIVKRSQWTREILKGMETSFLMSTILRIGSLMKVGFGSAGVEIIRNNLQKGQSKNMLILNSQGTTVSCIFLFCDIRQFTDATECLQEEVFVFTNRIAGVVHSICHSYGGSANKNVGDAFLVSWLLEDESNGVGGFKASRNSQTFNAKHHQADKALLSVVKICIALHHNEYYVETMSDHPRSALLKKLEDRPGPIVQMGFGLHAGKAVQGAIGSQRKIDATYVSEAVQRAEYLETSTKKYKLQMLMSDSFYGLLHPSNRRRCRKIDQIRFIDEDEDDYEYEEELLGQGDVMELYTYDLDVDALWEDSKKDVDAEYSIQSEESSMHVSSTRMTPHIAPMTSLRGSSSRVFLKNSRRISVRNADPKNDHHHSDYGGRSGSLTVGEPPSAAAHGSHVQGRGGVGGGATHDDIGRESTAEDSKDKEGKGVPELVLPTGPALYSNNIWSQSDMRRIRRKYTPAVLMKYSDGLKSYYSGNWDAARRHFESVMERFNDGPSRYFLKEMEKHGGVPPPHFEEFGRA